MGPLAGSAVSVIRSQGIRHSSRIAFPPFRGGGTPHRRQRMIRTTACAVVLLPDNLQVIGTLLTACLTSRRGHSLQGLVQTSRLPAGGPGGPWLVAAPGGQYSTKKDPVGLHPYQVFRLSPYRLAPSGRNEQQVCDGAASTWRISRYHGLVKPSFPSAPVPARQGRHPCATEGHGEEQAGTRANGRNQERTTNGNTAGDRGRAGEGGRGVGPPEAPRRRGGCRERPPGDGPPPGTRRAPGRTRTAPHHHRQNAPPERLTSAGRRRTTRGQKLPTEQKKGRGVLI